VWDAQQVGTDQASLGLGLQSVNVSARWGLLVNATPQPLHWYGTHCIGGWVGPRAALDGMENLASTRFRTPNRSAWSKSLHWLCNSGPPTGLLAFIKLQSLHTEGFCSMRTHTQSKILILHSHILCCPWFYALFVNACKNVKLHVFIMVYILCLLGINNLKVIRVLELLTLRLWNWGFTLRVWDERKFKHKPPTVWFPVTKKKRTILWDMSQNISVFKTSLSNGARYQNTRPWMTWL
jgi:hypothetical protein